jgi:hydroxyacylglutathione hydrolase
MNLLPIPAFSDNYIWMVHDGVQALVVDPGDATPVLAVLAEHGLQLQGIVVTHHHADHVGGVAQLQQATGAKVWGPADETLPEAVAAVTTRVRGGDSVHVLGSTWQVIDVPGHTRGHIAYVNHQALAQPVLFCGDTLFSGGCGRLFEGTPQQMQTSLDALSALPSSTLVCCAHEYTLSNLRFARAVEPNNAQLTHYLSRCEALRLQSLPTLPSDIATERAINPFLRTREASVAKAALDYDANVNPQDAASVLASLRQWKNNFS